MRMIWTGAIAAMALAGCAGPVQARTPQDTARDCAALVQTPIRQGAVTAAVMTPGPIPYCRVQLALRPTPRSRIGVEVWLPEPDHWNGKFLGTGNGAGGGSIVTGALRAGLERGYAVANTDMGNPTGDAMNFTFGIGNRDLAEDFGHRATDLMTLEAKRLVAAYYGQAPRYSYFQGCSTGGGQAWEQMQRLPSAYDGVVAGAPGNERTYLHTMILVRTALLLRSPGATIPKAKLAWVQSAVTARCDALDGVKDGIITDPRRCKFDPAALHCPAGDGPECLTDDQVRTLRGMYADTLVPSMGTVRQYEAMTRLNGGPQQTQGFARLFMAPGMGHCAGGVGPDRFDALAAMEAWVEKGQPPERILASRPAKGDRPATTRPLCPYPKAARWTGKGDPNDAANFICAG